MRNEVKIIRYELTNDNTQKTKIDILLARFPYGLCHHLRLQFCLIASFRSEDMPDNFFWV